MRGNPNAFLFLVLVFGVVAIVTPHKAETLLSLAACLGSLGIFLFMKRKKRV